MQHVGRTGVAAVLALAAALIMMMIVAARPAQASGTFCNNQVCLKSHDSGLYLGDLEITVWQGASPGWNQVHVWSSDNSFNVWTGGQQGSYLRTLVEWVHPRRYFWSGTRVCAEGFKDGRSVGLPCFTMRA